MPTNVGSGKPLPENPTAVVIVNPAAASGRDRARPLREAVGLLVEHGWRTSWRSTERGGHAEEIAREAAGGGTSVVVVAGGDGTVNEVVNGLAGTDTALAVLPAGTGNVLAAQLGLIGVPTPLHRPDPPSAALELTRSSLRRVDTGIVHPHGAPGRRFLLWAGIGLDAAVVHEAEGPSNDLKKALGVAAFGVMGLKSVLRSNAVEAEFRIDGTRLRDQLVLGVAANIPLYAGILDLTPAAQIDDGVLDLALFTGIRAGVGHLGSALIRYRGSSSSAQLRARRVRVATASPLPVHIDAEPYGSTPVVIESEPANLTLLVPPSAPEGLFVGARASVGTFAIVPDMCRRLPIGRWTVELWVRGGP